MEDHPLLEAVSRLNGLEYIMIKDIEHAFNVSLAIKEKRTTDFFIFYEEEKAHPWKSTFLNAIELRTLTDKAATKGMILSMMIAEGTPMDLAGVVRKFGHPSAVDVPPHGIPGTSVTYLYQSLESTLKFDAGPKPAEKVISITLDRMA